MLLPAEATASNRVVRSPDSYIRRALPECFMLMSCTAQVLHRWLLGGAGREKGGRPLCEELGGAMRTFRLDVHAHCLQMLSRSTVFIL